MYITHWTQPIMLGILNAQTGLVETNGMLVKRLDKITIYTLFIGIVAIVCAMTLAYYFPILKKSQLAILLGEVTIVIPWLVFIICLLLSLFQGSKH
ncbi:hypothetical protein [Cysteiniphilum sp. 6C5]|uniref:hypothetical protein n=1 Tax=unclassified Cysteiniphilum TaxID=2610889 RepID=UPI003F87E2F0